MALPTSTYSTMFEDNADVGGLSSLGKATETPDYSKMVQDAYATIGRTGVGDEANQIDPTGLAGWTAALQSGEIKPEDLSNRFSTAVTDYIAQNPNDKYTQYVNQYRAGLADNTAANATQTATSDTPASTTNTAGTGNILSGNILAGASWNSLNPTLEAQLTALNGQPTFDASVGGATTAETLKQLTDFTSAGGTFAPGSTVFLQTGGLDLVYGENKNTIQSNIDKIVSDLEARGVNVVLTGSPYAASFEDVKTNTFNPELDSIYSNIAANHSNVALVDSMGSILQDKSLLSDSIHPNDAGWEKYNQSVIDAYNGLVARGVDKTTAMDVAKQTATTEQGLSPEKGGTTQVQEATNTAATSNLKDLPVVRTVGTGEDAYNVVNVPGFGEFRDYDLKNWEPWRLQMWGLAKDENGNIKSTGGPAWETATGTSKTLFDQVNNISKMPGMESAYTGGAAEKSEGGLGSKEAMIWDLTQKLAAQGVENLADLKVRTVPVTTGLSGEGDPGTQYVQEIYNTKTGETVNGGGTTLGNHQTNYILTPLSNGMVIPTTSGTQSGWVEFRDQVVPIAAMALSFIQPELAPYIQGANAVNAAAHGNWTGAVLSGLSAASGLAGNVTAEIDALANAGKFAEAQALYDSSMLAQNAGTINTVKTVAGGLNALDKKNIAGAVNAGLTLGGATVPPEVRTVATVFSGLSAAGSGDTAGMLDAASALTGSSDAKLAASALRFKNAVESGDPNAIANATVGFKSSLESASKDNAAFNTFKSTLAAGGSSEDAFAAANNVSVAQQRSDALTTIYEHNNGENNLGINLVSPTQLAAADGYTGGIPKPEFKPNQVNIDTYTGKAFFTTIDASGKTTNIPIVIDEKTGNLLTSSENTAALNRATADIPKLSFSSELMRALQVLNPAIGDRTIIPTSSIVTQAELDALLGKEAIDVEAKDITGTTKAGKTVPSVLDMLKSVGGLDVSESVVGAEVLKNLPEVKDIVQKASNAQYVSELEQQLKTDPTNSNWLEEYKKVTGVDYDPSVSNVQDFGELIITAKRLNKDNTVIAKDTKGNDVTLGDLVLDLERVNKKSTTTTPTTTTPTTTTPTTTTPTTTTPTTTTPTTTTPTTTTPTTTTPTTTTPTTTTPTTTTPTTTTPTTTTPTTTTPTTITPTTTTPTTTTPTTTTPTTTTPTTTTPTTTTPTTTTPTTTTPTTTTPTTTTPTTTTPTTTTPTTTTPTTTTPTTTTPTTTTPTTTTPTTTPAVKPTNKPSGGNIGAPAPAPSVGADAKFSYKKVSEDAPILNPLLFTLAGVAIPQSTPEKTLTTEEEKDKKEEEDNKKEAPALDLLSFFKFAEGGMVPEHPMGQPEFYSEGGAGTTYIQGRGDGTSDQIPAMVANSEYVLPADIVSALGNGSSDSGASVLDQFIQTIRAHKHSNPPSELPPESKGPLEYLSDVHMKGKR